ncbi:MAG: hypothetical protein KGO81_06010 [Bacteroidota bacterium]|nr:hypothetical protein [Bacteroidota bacterium]
MVAIEKYKELITLGLDKRLERLKGGIIFDEFDPAVDNDRIFRNRLNRFIKRKNTEGLERMLQDLIRDFEFNYDQKFAEVLFQVSGCKIVPIPSQPKAFSTKRQVHIKYSGKKENCLTCVSIELPTGSGSIYCIRGKNPVLTADWLDSQTIEIRVPSVREEVKRVEIVKMYSETIHILYKEIC